MENQISGILSSAAINVSDVDLEEEYRALLGEENSPAAVPSLQLPLAPTTPLPTITTTEMVREPVAS